MKIVITGAHGTVGTVLWKTLEEQGHVVIPWDRREVPLDDYRGMRLFLEEVRPDILYHLAIASQPSGLENESWRVNVVWSGDLAWLCRVMGIRLVFTSTVMVFSDRNSGPFTIDSIPDADADYGYEKRRAEERVMAQNSQAVIARLGWQIGHEPGSNTMTDWIEKQMAFHGVVKAGRKWLPACSFLEDTAAVLAELFTREPGLYLIDSNRRWTFYEICQALNILHGNRWRIRPDDEFVFDQRMMDDRLSIPGLDKKLKNLPTQGTDGNFSGFS